MAKLSGSAWIEGTEFHFVAQTTQSEWYYTGEVVSTPSPAAAPGSVWIEGDYLHYIDASAVERRIPGINDSTGISALVGSIWIEGARIKAATSGSPANKRNFHSDVAHTDTGSGHGDSHGDAGGSHDDSHSDEHGDLFGSQHCDQHGDLADYSGHVDAYCDGSDVDDCGSAWINLHADYTAGGGHLDIHGDEHCDISVNTHGDSHGDSTSHDDTHSDHTDHSDVTHVDQPVEIGV